MKVCELSDCHAQLLGMSYFVLVLDDDRRIAVCPTCYRKIRRAMKNGG